jgi:hypothetical protein
VTETEAKAASNAMWGTIILVGGGAVFGALLVALGMTLGALLF